MYLLLFFFFFRLLVWLYSMFIPWPISVFCMPFCVGKFSTTKCSGFIWIQMLEDNVLISSETCMKNAIVDKRRNKNQQKIAHCRKIIQFLTINIDHFAIKQQIPNVMMNIRLNLRHATLWHRIESNCYEAIIMNEKFHAMKNNSSKIGWVNLLPYSGLCVLSFSRISAAFDF